MQKLYFSIDIKAQREKVWKVLWEDATYRDWTSVFAEGSHAKSDWKEGGRIEFLDPSGDGMIAVIDKLVPNEFMSFKHLGEIREGKEQPWDEGAGGMENYTLKENGEYTALTVDLDSPEEYRDMFEDIFPKALERVKELAEA